MTYQEKIKDLLQWMYGMVCDFAGSSTYDIPYEWVKDGYQLDLTNKDVQDDIKDAWASEFLDLFQAMDFDDLHQKVYVMTWKSNNKKKYTIDNYEEFCKNALQSPPTEEFEDGSIDEDEWYKEHNIHIITGNHDIELEYHADNVNEIEFALREMYEVEKDIIGATTGNTVGSEYRPAELSDIIQFAIQDEFNHFGYKMNSFEEFIQYFIKKEWDLEKVMWHYTIIFKDIKHYNDCYKCNFGKLDMNTMNGICPSKIRDIVDGLICKDRELLYGVTEDDKSSDIVFVMDNTLRPGGDLIGWFYGEPNEEYIDELIADYKKKLFGEEN